MFAGGRGRGRRRSESEEDEDDNDQDKVSVDTALHCSHQPYDVTFALTVNNLPTADSIVERRDASRNQNEARSAEGAEQ